MREIARQGSVFMAAGSVAACATSSAPPPATIASSTPKPALVVFLTVDQMRGDYLNRFGPQLTGGFGRLYRGGAVMTRAYHDHAITETAPGHSTTMSGRFPVHTGIVMNSRGVGDSTVTLIGASGAAASPRRFQGTTLTDWMRAANPKMRVLSISRKDRAAILPIGKSKSPVFWYAPSAGIFTTSTYYGDSLPSWLVAYNARNAPSRYVGRVWTPLLPDSAYAEADSIALENGGKDYAFPHALPADSAKAVAQLPLFPWMDELTLDAALTGVNALQLGQRGETDLLAISLSTTDAIGHMYGPDSKEVHDQILRLDRELAVFFDSLFTLVDSTRVIVTLTGDHGVGPIPGVRSRDPNHNGINVDVRPVVTSFTASLAAKNLGRSAFAFSEGVLTIDRGALAAAKVNPDSLVFAFRDSIRKVPGVLRADRISELQRKDTVHDAIARRWLHMFDSDSLAALVVTLEPYDYWGANPAGGEHGTPHDYDAHVPVVFYGAPFKPGCYDRVARVVDMAPTLAQVLGVTPLEKVDGRVLTQVIRPPIAK